mmetsp:Transcript_16156/g.34921  ORF Transcript_16156/g.34921 Transcript_16156/m.34921 type:complete len:239 (-) Transcript_16156:107-823(-)|eukprot:CAMPEP_0172318668 /NCGR_PEP_ID=MMETSP1058-20130122/35501_1 /TAXON_ID=83371 /ORGANISM="Detonula confervacea, Strain CCMP 353" /LENGTH=238 /DNA_ID=CAMNT_0013033549 /DNA_START=55 /DNA_END=771 /DNA_ORIENTATION=+
MAPIAAAVIKQSRDQRLGIGLRNNVADDPNGPINISSIASDGLFSDSGLIVGMQILSINNISMCGMTSGQAIQILKDTEGQVMVVADNPIQTAVIAVTPAQSIAQGRKRGYIILKKTFKYNPSAGFQMSTKKSYSFHGPVTQDMVACINGKLQGLRLINSANRLQFNINNTGHFHGTMNHEAQKHHEEDFVVAILEAMEELGYYFRFQYDAEAFSTKMFIGGDSYTSKELFIFHKVQE